MLPQSLVSVYHEYKKDTSSIATWLASTAKECGYPAALLPSTPSAPTAQGPATGGRLKGKARVAAKKAKEKAQGGPAPKPQGPPINRYIISIKDFVPLAECISTSKIPSLCVPQAFFTTLDRVIAVRSSFSQELKEQNAAPDAQSDAKHLHFVGILKKVREVLEQWKPAAAASTPDPVSILTNRFDALKVYVPSEEFVNAPDIERPKPRKERAEVFEVDPSQLLAEAIVAFQMMCIDLDKIRDKLSALWEGVVGEDGSDFDPAVLAVVTNTGIEFGKSIIEEVLPIFQPHGGIRKIMNLYLSLIPTAPGKSIMDPRTWDKDPEVREEYYDILSQTYFMVYNVLDALSKVPYRGVPPVYPEGSFGELDSQTDWESKPVDQKMKEDNVITTELWFEALSLVHHVPDYPFTDEFVRGVKEYKATKQIPFSLAFAAQVNLDIHQVVGTYAETSIDTLIRRLKHMDGVLCSTLLFQQNRKSPHWTSSSQKWMQETRDGFEWFLKDPLHEVKVLAFRNDPGGQQVLRGIKKWRLLRRSPVMAGLALHYHRAEMHEAGLLFTNQWGSLTLPGHLYNALSEGGYCKALWTDMERLFDFFGEEQFFVGGKPTNTSDYVNRFMLQIGVSASALTNQSRRSKKVGINDFSRAGARFLTSRATFHRRFEDRYHKNANQMIWTPEYISEILLRDKDDKKQEQSETVRASPPELLGALAIALHDEIHEVSFPYLSLHTMIWVFLEAWKDCWEDALRASYGPDYIQQEWQMPFLIGQVLALADGVDGDDGGLRVAGDALDVADSEMTTSIGTQMMYRLSGRDYDIPKEKIKWLISLAGHAGDGSDSGDDDDDDYESRPLRIPPHRCD
ncbi:unnamed protein product [Clonostachys rosea]|uniref:DUF6604 domain-containing protein n=1 Tax=Bionectria ochroleuca TaxID=29856 RepID=A0ABY6ULP5_BIOOC|nr:unnamed protein product [Clonostachys rosea]